MTVKDRIIRTQEDCLGPFIIHTSKDCLSSIIYNLRALQIEGREILH